MAEPAAFILVTKTSLLPPLYVPSIGLTVGKLVEAVAPHLLAEQKNDYAAALALDREALEIFRRRYGESHYMVGAAQVAMVNIYFALGDYAQAEAVANEYFKQHQSPYFGILASYAYSQIVKGNYQAAENAISQILAQAQNQDAKPYMMPSVLSTQSFMAYRRGDYTQAIAYACGHPVMVENARAILQRARFPKIQIHTEKYFTIKLPR